MTYIFQSTGEYLGFIDKGYFFSRDNEYIAWVENENVWDQLSGEFTGRVVEKEGFHYILKNRFSVNPLPRTRKQSPPRPVFPQLPKEKPQPISLDVEKEDSYKIRR